MALIGCRSEEAVFDVIADFLTEVVPATLTIVNQATSDGHFTTRRVLGVDDTLLARSAKLVGFDVVGRRFAITEEYRSKYFSASLSKVEGGFSELARSEIPPRLGKVMEKVFGLHDTYTIGIAEDGAEYGSIHIIMREPDAQPPARIIDAFVRQCILALSAVTRAAEVEETARSLEVLLAERERNVETLARSLSAVINVVSHAVELRDPYTAGHQRRVCALATGIARQSGMSESEIEDIRVAALMHDVGKISIPAEILSKPGRLTPTEFALVKSHSEAGCAIIKSAHMREPIAELVYQHHERCDGSGYPRALLGEALLPGAKVLMVSDVVEAIASHRPYRPAIGMDAALEEITSNAGVLYDRDVVDACVAVVQGGFDFDDETD